MEDLILVCNLQVYCYPIWASLIDAFYANWYGSLAVGTHLPSSQSEFRSAGQEGPDNAAIWHNVGAGHI